MEMNEAGPPPLKRWELFSVEFCAVYAFEVGLMSLGDPLAAWLIGGRSGLCVEQAFEEVELEDAREDDGEALGR